MNYLVTGGAGFIGYNLCNYLKSNDKVVVVDDFSSGKPENKISGITYLNNNILNYDFICNILREFNPSAIFHLAAIPRVKYSVENPKITSDSNIIGTINLLEAIRTTKINCKLILSSSSSVYGGADQLPTPEDYPKNPKSPYALQKSQSEEWCKIYSQLYGIETVILRYFNVFGERSFYGGSYSVVIPAWAYSIYADNSVKPFIEGDGTQSRDFCEVDNVVQANMLAATTEHKFYGEIFNIAQGQSCSLIKLLSIFEEFLGKKLDIEYKEPRIGDVKHTLADISKAQNLLNYNPNTNFKEQVNKILLWYKNFYASVTKIQQSN